MLGAGLLYLIFISGLIIGGDAARDAISPVVGSVLILVFSGAHYGATLLRVYEKASERRIYRTLSVYGTVVMLAVLIGALHSPLAGSLLITLYLTWSPWHYTGQNYGIAVMFLRRRGVEFTPATKRWLHASFVLSFVSVFLNFHFEGGVSQGNPLGYTQLDTTGFHFISLGLPSDLRTVLMPVVGLGYGVSVLVALTLLVRSESFRKVAPTALVMLTQAVWFAIPHIGFYLDWTTRIPALNPVGGDLFRFYFVWTAVGHAIQYLWITTYYAKAEAAWRGFSPYFLKAFVFGNAVWAAPVMLLGPERLGRPDFESGLAMCVAAAVNLHHFVLDGAIWKLRNPRIAAVLFRNRGEPLVSERSQGSRSFGRRIAWAIGGLFCFANVIPEIDIERRLPQALLRKDFVAAESILDRAALYGRDSSNWRAQLANGLVKTQDPWRAIRQYKRSLDFYPQSAGFGQLGILVAKLEGLDEAIVIWGEGLEKFPQDIDLNRRMGMGLMKAARVPAALPFLEKWAELSPGDAAAIDAVEAARARITD